MRHLLALSAALVLAGCNTGPSLVGKWDVTGIPNMPAGATSTMSFAAPDKLTMVMHSDVPIPTVKATMTATINGTYTLKVDVLTIKASSADLKFEGLPEQLKTLAEQNAETGKKQMLDEINKNPDGKIKWEGADKVTVSGSGSTMTLTRQKG